MVYPFYNEKSGAPNDVAPHLKTINEVMVKKKRNRGALKRDNLDYFIMKDSKIFTSYLQFIKGYKMTQVDQ